MSSVKSCKCLTVENLVESVPLMQGLPQGIIEGIVARLKFEVYLPQDIIISSNTLGDSMYFIEHGAVSVLAPSGRSIAQLKDGDFFGEMALMTNERRNSTVVATSFCDVYQLFKKDFEEVVVGYPEVYAHLVKTAEQRIKQLSVEPKSEDMHQVKTFEPRETLRKKIFKRFQKTDYDDSL